jgi:hypothetical protein
VWVEVVAVEERLLVMKVELEGPDALVERETVFAVSGEENVTGGLVPGMRGIVVLIATDAQRRQKFGDVQETGKYERTIEEVLGTPLGVEEQPCEVSIQAVTAPSASSKKLGLKLSLGRIIGLFQ